MTSYLTSIDTFSLSRTVFEIFEFKVFRVWPWPLTLKGHLRSKIFLPFESPYITPYLTSIDTFSLSRTVFEIFDFKVFRVWPWLLTFKSHLRSKIYMPFESLYMTSYLSSIYTFSLSRTVFEIFDFKVCRVWPWPLTFKGHLRSKIFLPFERPYMTSYLTFIATSLYLVPFPRKIGSKFWWSRKMAEFDLFKIKVIDQISSFSRKGSDSRQTALINISRVKIGSAVLAAPSSKSVKSWKKKEKKEKKGRTLICWVYVPPSPKIFPKPNFAKLFRSMT